MAPLPIGRILAQIVVPVIAVLARALPAAYAQAVQNAKKNGVDAAKQSASIISRRMAKDEALMVLNLSEQEATAEAVQQQYEKYFAANAVENGGSFYVQSKVYRAKEMLDEYLREKRMEEKSNQKQSSSSS
mmetsp:Transcript_17798/g.30246  ORF Transcript_17798/g.30246 Transcript_17798/m.30246 type:complete len:131 (-) Transcript_17798:384-776(-)